MLIKGILRKSVGWKGHKFNDGGESRFRGAGCGTQKGWQESFRAKIQNLGEGNYSSFIHHIERSMVVMVSRGHLNPYSTSQSTLVRPVLQPRGCIDITECRTGYYVVSPTFLPGGKHGVCGINFIIHASLVSPLPAQLLRDFKIRIGPNFELFLISTELLCLWYL